MNRTLIAALFLVVLVLLVGTARGVYDPAKLSQEGRLEAPSYKPGEIIVKFKKPAADKLEEQLSKGKTLGMLNLSSSLDNLNRKYKVRNIEPLIKNFKAKRQRIKALLKKDKASLTKREKHILRRLKRAPKGAKVPDLGRIYKIQLKPGQSEQQAVAEYNENTNVEYAQLNYIVSILATEPNDPNYPEQWPLNNTGQNYPIPGGETESGTLDCDIDAPEAWDINTGSSDIIVAVIDSGVDYNHTDLDDNMWTDPNGHHGYDFANDDDDPVDDHGHGTHCAGIIAAEGNNATDIAGVNWDASIMAVKFFDEYGFGDISDGALAIEYAVDNGADILSNSWGFRAPNFSTPLLEDAVDYAYASGCMVVFAAGNKGKVNDLYLPNIAYYSPQNHPKTFAVAATDSDDERAIFSSYGDPVDVAAPGVDILSLHAVGTDMYRDGEHYYPDGDPNATMYIASGTSMACPHAAGLAALCLAEEPNLATGDLWVLIKNGADDLGDAGEDIYFGAGRINAYKTLGYISTMTDPNKTSNPYPASGATNQSVNVHLSWEMDNWTASHDMYFGTSYSSVNAANTSSDEYRGDVFVTWFDPNTLDLNSTYYWRVDAKNYSGTTKGDVWNFTTGPDGVIYVDTDASGNNNGSSWADAFTNLQDAVEKAFVGDEIWVAQGTYKPTSTTDPNISFEPREGIDLYGGFAGTETDPDGRDPNLNANITILSGDIGTVDDANDNSYHVITLMGNANTSTFIDRFKITGGNASVGSDTRAYGGGVYSEMSYATFKDCVFTDNYARYGGGALFAFGCSVTLSNSLFSENEAGLGGAVVFYYGLASGQMVTDCTFEQNEAFYLGWPETRETFAGGSGLGGAIYLLSVPAVTITRCELTNNTARSTGGAISCMYGDLTVSDCTFTGNTATTMVPPTGGLDCAYLWTLSVENCTFSQNSDVGLKFKSAMWDIIPVIRNCTFVENSGMGLLTSTGLGTIEDCNFVDNEGPGIKCENFTLEFLNIRSCIFTGNTNTDASADSAGGGMCNYNASPIVTNCTFTRNDAVYGGGIYNCSDKDYSPASPKVTNCVFWANTASTSGGEIYNKTTDPNAQSDPNFGYCDIEGGLNGSKCGGLDSTDGGGNINSDPLLVDPNNGDFHLDVNSPCVNAGDSNRDYSGQKDIDSEPRVMAGRVDIGADEFSGIFNLDKQLWYDTIQDAIDAASNGEVIEVGPGIYYETIDFSGKAIEVRGADPNDWDVVAQTIIDANSPSYGWAVEFFSGEDANSILSGFTIRNAHEGIYATSTTPTIKWCIIEDNFYGVKAWGASLTLKNNKISDNYAGIIAVLGGVPHILNNWFYGNDYGIAIAGAGSPATIRNNSIAYNSATGIWVGSGTAPDISNCILWNENADDLYGCTATYSCIEDGDGVGDPNTHNIDDDPLFVDPNNYDYHLQSSSPCIDVGDPSGDYTGEYDIDGDDRVIDIAGKGDGIVDVDMGGDEYKEPD